MTSRFEGLERALLALFIASGFAGLIYQSIWSHYLGLTLGHAAYAQTLVLGIFMGGMALGAWLVGRYGIGWRRLVAAYALVELLIGFAGLAFHPLFVGYTEFSQATVYPELSSPAAVRAWQWGSAALMIAPQSILLGMTFPLMSGGYLRVAPRADGEILGGLYFSNSIGAAVGALAATFVLLPWVGMPGAMAIAGAINLAVAALAWWLARRVDSAAATVTAAAVPAVAEAPTDSRGFYRMMLAAAGITGASSFVYEVGWVRLLNQSLGTTVHSFELMLAAFILGLAFGGLWIRRRSAGIADPAAYAAVAQVLMGIAALVSIPVFSQSFRWVGALMGSLPRDDGGYFLFSLGSGGIALLVMFPAAFFAGMTLPLFTMALLRRGFGETSIGRIYAANTLGAIVGVVLAMHVLIPLLGLRLAVMLAAVVDIALGLVLLRAYVQVPAPRRLAAAVVASLVVLAVSVPLGRLEPRALASGVFRHGSASLNESAEVLYLRDGKTASVALYTVGSYATISTNGKPDASLEMDPALGSSPDEVTMLLAAALPLAIHPHPEEVAVIGWGSGLTTHTLLGSPAPRLVDSIEIEQAMVDGARLFDHRVARGYTDPRSHIHIDDARTYFSAGRRQYDVIISEPSNPWVSGVSALFTKQFYGFMRGHLKEGGVVVQWLQSYELNDRLLGTMLAALESEFDHIDIYLTNYADLLFVASAQPLPALDSRRIGDGMLAHELGRVGLAGQADYAVRRIGSERLLHTLVVLTGSQPHSDFYPVVALQAPAARFKSERAEWLPTLLGFGMPVLEMTDGRKPAAIADHVRYRDESTGARDHWYAATIRSALVDGDDSRLARFQRSLPARVQRLRTAGTAAADPDAWFKDLAEVAERSLAQLPPQDLVGLWTAPVWVPADAAADPRIAAVLAAYDAAARRDPEEMRRTGGAALSALGSEAPQEVREHMLMIALLGASASEGATGVREVEESLGRMVRPTGDYGLARAFLLAWGDVGAGG